MQISQLKIPMNFQLKNKFQAPNNIFSQIETDLKMIKEKHQASQILQSTSHQNQMYQEVLEHLEYMLRINNDQHIKFKQIQIVARDDQKLSQIKMNPPSQINNNKYRVTINIQNELIREEFQKPQTYKDFFLFLLDKFPYQLKSSFVILDQNNQIFKINWDQLIISGANNKDFQFTIQLLENQLENLQQQIKELKEQNQQLLIKQKELIDLLKQKEEFQYQRSQISQKKDSELQKYSKLKKDSELRKDFELKKDSELKIVESQINQIFQKEISVLMKPQQQMNNEQQLVIQYQINKPQFKNQSQQSNKQYQMKQSEENNQNQQDTINDYNNNIFKSYNPQFNHQDSNLKFYSIISDRSSQLKSQMLNVQYNCEYCQKKVEKQQIILQCLHTYHEDCLKEFFQNQILQKKPILNCLCNNKITNINKMKFLEDRLLQQLYKNQLNAIEEKYQNKFRKCNKCRFMHIEEKQMQQQQKICYQCGIEAHY